MNWIKKHKILLIIIAIILGFYGVSAWSQYSWHDKFKSEVGSDWIVFDEQKNAADPIFTYTFFNPPINRLGLIQASSIKRIDDNIFQYNIMWADGLIGNRMPAETFVSFADCKKGLGGSLKKGIDNFSSLNDIEWRHPSDNSYVTSEQDKEKLTQSFNKQCLILTQTK